MPLALPEIKVENTNVHHTVRIMGYQVNTFTKKTLFQFVEDASKREQAPVLLMNHNLHSIYLARRDSEMQKAYARADAIHIDGMPLVWMGRIKKLPVTAENRLTSLDWIEDLLGEFASRGTRVFLLGGKPGVAEQFAMKMRYKYPTLDIAWHHGYFDVEINESQGVNVIEIIQQFQPQVLLLGLGMPLQEKWAFREVDRLGVPLVWTLGAFMDYFVGEQVRPPRGLAARGFEGVFRLFTNPRRLWRRYLLEPLALLPWIIGDLSEVKVSKREEVSS